MLLSRLLESAIRVGTLTSDTRCESLSYPKFHSSEMPPIGDTLARPPRSNRKNMLSNFSFQFLG